MTQRDFHLHNGKKGAALGIRVIPRARRNEIIEILHDGTIRVRLKSSPKDKEINQTLTDFLSSILDVPVSRIDVVAGQSRRDKLVSILEIDAQTAQERILKNLV